MNALPSTVRTARLVAERFEWRHLPELDAFNKDERVMHWFGGTGTTDETKEWMAARIRLWEERGFGPYVLYEVTSAREAGGDVGEAGGGEEAAPGRFAGRAGLQTVEVHGVEEIELLYALLPEAQGRGLATEMGRALVALAFGVLALDDVMAYIRPDNPRSRNVLAKLGFSYERDWEHEGRTSEIYRLRRPSGTA